MTHTSFELTLDPEHRALLSMLHERAVRHPTEVEAMSKDELLRALAVEFRREFVRIPKGTPASRCRWCGAVVYWIPSRYAKAPRREAIALPFPGTDYAPTKRREGQGRNHLGDCPHSIYVQAER